MWAAFKVSWWYIDSRYAVKNIEEMAVEGGDAITSKESNSTPN